MGYQDSRYQALIHDLNNALAISEGFIKGFEKRFRNQQLKSQDEELQKLTKAINGVQRSIGLLKELRGLIHQELERGEE